MSAKPDSASAMKIGGVDFPEPLLNALRDGKLVVFAGAGVSMGPPAGLPSFRELAEGLDNPSGGHGVGHTSRKLSAPHMLPSG